MMMYDGYSYDEIEQMNPHITRKSKVYCNFCLEHFISYHSLKNSVVYDNYNVETLGIKFRIHLCPRCGYYTITNKDLKITKCEKTASTIKRIWKFFV